MPTKYQKSRESERPWLTNLASDISKEYCKVCCQKIKTNQKHVKHVKAVSGSGEQTTVVAGINGNVKLCQSNLQESLTLQQQIGKAEVIQALHVFESSQPFQSTDKDSKRFQKMFPDSKIASGYAQHADKTRYNIVYQCHL